MPRPIAHHPKKAARRSLSRESWLISSSAKQILVDEVHLPTHVHPELQRAGHIPDPHFADNELAVAWVDDEPWTFSLEFQWQPNDHLPQTRLEFLGLDTIATIVLNGHEIGRSHNMWVPFVADVRGHLVAGSNRIEVHFEPAKLVAEQRRRDYIAGNHLRDDISGLEQRCFIRKAQYSFGWDWGPRLISCGIWRDVLLVDYASLVDEISVSQAHEEDAVAVTIATSPIPEHRARHQIFDRENQALVGEVDGDGTIVITQPKKWHPDDPKLYDLVTTLFDEESMVLDERQFSLGLRTVELRQDPTPFGITFEFIVNGEPIWAKGANWIPNHSFMTPHMSARERVRDAKQMNMNMLRVWGGGLMDPDDFYEACDELGILVWQDFPYACGYYPDDDAAQTECETETRAIFQRLSHHPCLATWCGNNENLMMFEGKWGGAERTPDRFIGEKLFDGTIPMVLEKLGADVAYVAGSPHGVTGDCNGMERGDQHFWDVWHGRGDWIHYRDFDGSFCSEFGFLSSCGKSAWSSALPPNVESADDALVAFHNRANKPTYVDLIELHYPRPQTLDDLVYFSQLNQRDAMRAALEQMRFSAFCRGALIWQLNDCWPVQSWSLVDSAGEWKAAAQEVRQQFGSVSVRVLAVPDGLQVDILNSRKAELVDEMVVRGESYAGEGWSAARQVSVEPGAVASVHVDMPTQTDMVSIAVGGKKVFRLLVEPKAVPQDAQEITLSRPSELDTWQIVTHAPLVDLWLTFQFPIEERLRFDGLLPGDVVTLPFRDDPVPVVARSLAGIHPVRWGRSQ